MELYDVMRTTFSAREYTDEQVSDDTLHRILENARFASSGGNRQGWHVIVVRDRSKRQALANLLQPVMQRYGLMARAGENPFNTVEPSQVQHSEPPRARTLNRLVQPITQAPLLLLVLVDLKVVASMDKDLDRIGVISGASIYPFVWNILLSARNEGLGGVITTGIAAEEPAVQELLDIPEHYAIAALIPIGTPVKQLTKLRRKEVEEFVSLDKFANDYPFKNDT